MINGWTVGNVVALWQQHAVRLLAWSSVAQAGYILVPFGAVAAASREEISAVLSRSTGYLAMYAVVNLCAFGVAAVILVGVPEPASPTASTGRVFADLRRYPKLIGGLDPRRLRVLAGRVVASGGLLPGDLAAIQAATTQPRCIDGRGGRAATGQDPGRGGDRHPGTAGDLAVIGQEDVPVPRRLPARHRLHAARASTAPSRAAVHPRLLRSTACLLPSAFEKGSGGTVRIRPTSAERKPPG